MNTQLIPAFSVTAMVAGLAYAAYLRCTQQRLTVLPNHRRTMPLSIDLGRRDQGDDRQEPKRPEAA